MYFLSKIHSASLKALQVTILIPFLFILNNAANAKSDLPHIPPVDVKMSLKKVSSHVYYAQGVAGIATDNKGFISNSAVIITDEGIIIFDALGTPSLAKKLVSKIREISDKPIKKIFISHYHADHFFGLQGLLTKDVEIYAPAGAQKYLAREGAEVRLNERRESLKPWVNKTTKLIPASHYLSEDMVFKFGGLDISVLLFGSAHSDGDLSLFVKQDEVLITGDLLFTGRIPFVGGDDVQNWVKKIDELAKYPAKWIIPGHGAAFKEFEKGSKLTKNYLNLLYTVMTNGVDELMSFEEIYKNTDWSEFENLPAFKTGNRINAYRVFLNAEKAALESQ
ncbi:MAG: MBL fold metallo-hydrolase [Gammaproteobacteria bacterium]|nr:MBL fold metallo-hydrolase [Gammaproteobacteria bacterium]